MRVPNEHDVPRVLVKGVGGLSAVAHQVCRHLNICKGNSFCDTDVGSGAIFCGLRNFENVWLNVTGDIRLLELYKAIQYDVGQVLRGVEGLPVDRDTYEALKKEEWSPSHELYIRCLGYRGWWGGNHARLRKGVPEHVAAWHFALAMLPAVSYKLRNVRWGIGPADIVLGHQVWDKGCTHLLCKEGEGKIRAAFSSGLILWEL